jgi:hypothetical protein
MLSLANQLVKEDKQFSTNKPCVQKLEGKIFTFSISVITFEEKTFQQSKMGTVIHPTDLNKESIERILRDFYKNPKLKITQVKNFQLIQSSQVFI